MLSWIANHLAVPYTKLFCYNNICLFCFDNTNIQLIAILDSKNLIVLLAWIVNCFYFYIFDAILDSKFKWLLSWIAKNNSFIYNIYNNQIANCFDILAKPPLGSANVLLSWIVLYFWVISTGIIEESMFSSACFLQTC